MNGVGLLVSGHGSPEVADRQEQLFLFLQCGGVGAADHQWQELPLLPFGTHQELNGASCEKEDDDKFRKVQNMIDWTASNAAIIAFTTFSITSSSVRTLRL